jgi:osmotically-inducible protein OsmY
MRNVIILFVLTALPLINGCTTFVVGGAAATGAMVGVDRRTVGTIAEDEGIEIKAANRISRKFKGTHLNVTSYNRMVLLTGEIGSDADKIEAGLIAQAVENVRGLFNELQVAGNTSLTVRANDSYLTSKVKTRFVDAQKFNAVHVKVVTENGVVYLMGLVKRHEADAATDIARTTGGVQKVVRVFEYID